MAQESKAAVELPAIEDLHVSAELTPPASSPNPWNDSTPLEKPATDLAEAPETTELHHAPDISAMDPTIVAGLGSEKEDNFEPPSTEEVLSEFDPLANQEEKEAREAWASAEGHPPDTSASEQLPPPIPPSKDDLMLLSPTSPMSGASTSPFPSLSAFARSFSIPSLSRSRPLSMEGAKAVPSTPNSLSTFVAQQQKPAESTPPRTDTPDSQDSGSGDRAKGESQFDFQKFLDQMKSRSAEPVAKYLKSFLGNFAKRSFTVHDQIKIINDFLTFISKQMRECDVWKNASDLEFDNAMEGMEKLVMNQLYQFTFTPQVVKAIPPRQVTADDLEKDRVLSQRIALFGWIEERHLDIPEGEGGHGFMMFAQQELLKINHYKAPRDKLICILNCCKVIFGLIRHLQHEEGADSFIPILIFVVLKANPEHLLSNVEFINRFRNPEKLQSEAGYYLSSLMGAVSFIESMDHTSLSNITQEEFENNVEEAIQYLPVSESNSPSIPPSDPSTPFRPVASPHAGEESAQPLSLSTPEPSSATFSDDAKRLLQKTGDTISKPLNAIGKIFNDALDGAEQKLTYLPGPFAPFELGRENRANQPPNVSHWSHPDQIQAHSNSSSRAGTPAPLQLQTPMGRDGSLLPPIQTPYKPRVRRIPSPSYTGSPGFSPEDTPSRSGPYTNQPLALGASQPFYGHQSMPPQRVGALVGDGSDSAHVSRTPTPNLDLAGMQEEIDHAHIKAAAAAKETLLQIFPHVDPEIVGWVLEANAGDLGKSIEGLLEMSTES
ncbi:hypothetical protein C8J56DRAFT_870192 [Mycena floridula]|nr:hypothetical protein C8J56DRAFT_870192 [Mycena floridula]